MLGSRLKPGGRSNGAENESKGKGKSQGKGGSQGPTKGQDEGSGSTGCKSQDGFEKAGRERRRSSRCRTRRGLGSRKRGPSKRPGRHEADFHRAGDSHSRKLLPTSLSPLRRLHRVEGRTRRDLPEDEAFRHSNREPAAVWHRATRAGVQSPSLQRRLFRGSSGRRLGPHQERTEVLRNGERRRLDQQLGDASQRRHFGRVGELESQSRRSSSSSPTRRRRGERASAREGGRREKEGKKEKEEKEGQERKEAKGRGERRGDKASQKESVILVRRDNFQHRQGQAPKGSLLEEREGSVSWDRPRSQRKDPQQDCPKGAEAFEEERRKGQHQWLFEWVVERQQCLGGADSREPLWRGQQGHDSGRCLSGGPHEPSGDPDATRTSTRIGELRHEQQHPACSNSILSTAPFKAGICPNGKGVVDIVSDVGFTASEQTRCSSGHRDPANQIVGAVPQRSSLERCAEVGGLAERNAVVDTSPRSYICPAPGLQRGPYEMGSRVPRWQTSEARKSRSREGCKRRWEEPASKGGKRQGQRVAAERRPGQKERLRREGGEESKATCSDLTVSGANASVNPMKEDSLVQKDSQYEGGAAQKTTAYERGLAMASQQQGFELAPHVIDAEDSILQDHCKSTAGALASDKNSFSDGSHQGARSTDFGVSPKPLMMTGDSTMVDAEKSDALSNLDGMIMGRCGDFLLQRLLEVLPFRSQCTGRGGKMSLYPLPTSREMLVATFPNLASFEVSWMICCLVCLNSLWGGDLFFDGKMNEVQRDCIEHLVVVIKRFCAFDAPLARVDWKQFLSVKTIDYKGDEVRVARRFTWSNISPALPKEIGRVPLSEVCVLGCCHYVLNFDDYLRPSSEWSLGRAPKVMVDDCEWGQVCEGLVKSGICVFLEECEVHHVGGIPLLNGMFGVTKDEWAQSGTEIYRLIMNLIPLNRLCLPLAGDVGTLPAWSTMSPFFLQPSEHLLVSSEDVKCFFYTISVPSCWWKYLAFNKLVPDSILPLHLRGKRVYVASQVLPMGFLNSVSLAQHVHRNLVKFSREGHPGTNIPEGELRKDHPFTVANPNWRVYLDNYDLLERVEATDMVEHQGTLAPGALALRQVYEQWEVPRNAKKSVQRSSFCEMQGATIDGVAGIAYPRESKLSKYFGLALSLVELKTATQKQWQIVCGGLVYFTMFRRPLLGSLNQVWGHIESFNQGHRVQAVPAECRLEVLRLLGMLPLAHLDFRLPVHSQVTCSDASTSGGGICASVGTSAMGSHIAEGHLCGAAVASTKDFSVLVVGLFDGLGALRVAVDLLGVQVLGYVSVEKHAPAQRVVESHFPGVKVVHDVQSVDHNLVHQLSLEFSQADLILLGAGPPCQGVSGLNCDRKGALKEERSSLFAEVPRIRDLFRQHFPWCPTYSLMESVASMDATDRHHMSTAFGCEPVLCDAGDLTWCRRPRLYWCDWELVNSPGFSLEAMEADQPVQLHLEGHQDIVHVLRAGWVKVEPTLCFPTFTTSRPRAQPGRKPVGIQQCSLEELTRWTADQHRFPPYQYCEKHCVVNVRDELRVPDIQEREAMLGFPVNYTAPCVGKSLRKGSDYSDTRLTLLGNTWSVPVVAALLSQLFSRLGFTSVLTPQEILDALVPGTGVTLQSRLFRLPLNPSRRIAPYQSYFNQRGRHLVEFNNNAAGQISSTSSHSPSQVLAVEGGVRMEVAASR